MPFLAGCYQAVSGVWRLIDVDVLAEEGQKWEVGREKHLKTLYTLLFLSKKKKPLSDGKDAKS